MKEEETQLISTGEFLNSIQTVLHSEKFVEKFTQHITRSKRMVRPGARILDWAKFTLESPIDKIRNEVLLFLLKKSGLSSRERNFLWQMVHPILEPLLQEYHVAKQFQVGTWVILEDGSTATIKEVYQPDPFTGTAKVRIRKAVSKNYKDGSTKLVLPFDELTLDPNQKKVE